MAKKKRELILICSNEYMGDIEEHHKTLKSARISAETWVKQQDYEKEDCGIYEVINDTYTQRAYRVFKEED